MLERYLGDERKASIDWESMGVGAPAIIGFATLASAAMIEPSRPLDELGLEAKLILYLARPRGIIDLRGSNDAFDSSDRLLTVYLEQDDERTIALRSPGDIRQGVKFLEGFRQLCGSGLVIHHLHHEFSLSNRGFLHADTITKDEVEPLASYVHSVG